MTPEFIEECVKHSGTCYFKWNGVTYILEGLIEIHNGEGGLRDGVTYREAYTGKAGFNFNTMCRPITACGEWEYHCHHTITGPGGSYR